MTQSFDSYLRDLLGIKDLQTSLAAVAGDVQTTKNLVTQILQKEGRIMTSQDDILNALASEKQAISDAAARVSNQITELQTELQAAIATGDPTKAQAILDQITADTGQIQSIASTPTPAPAP